MSHDQHSAQPSELATERTRLRKTEDRLNEIERAYDLLLSENAALRVELALKLIEFGQVRTVS